MNNLNKAKHLYEKAKNQIEEKRFDHALLSFKKALEINNNNAEVLSLIGYVHYKLNFKMKTKNEVYEISKQALELDDTSQEAWLHMGNGHSYLDNYSEAIECYRKGEELGYGNVRLYNNLGSAYLKMGDIERALKNYNKGLQINSNFSPLLNNLGYLYTRKREFDEAISYLEKAVKEDPNYSAPLNNLGNIFNEKREFDKAVDYYHKAIEIDPENQHALNNLGTVYYAKGNYEEAIRFFNKAIVINSDYGDPWMNLGAICSDKGKFLDAIRYFDKSIELNPTLFKAWYNKGNAYINLNNTEEAIKSYKKAIKIEPSYLPAWSNLGSAFSKNNDFNEAKKSFNKALEINPNSIIDLFNLGNLYRFRGGFEKAISFYQRCIDLDSNNGIAWYNQGISYLMINDYVMAINCLEEAIYILPQNPGTWGNLGMAYEGQLDFENAVKCFLTVLNINPKDILALTKIGQIYVMENKADKAINYLKKALNIESIPVIHLDSMGYEIYHVKSENEDKIKRDEKIIISFTPDILASLGMAYHQLGNDHEALANLELSIESYPNNFIGYANLGIFYLNKFNFSQAIIELNKAIKIIKDKRLINELEKVEKFKNIAESAMTLSPDLKKIDEQINSLLQIEDIHILISTCGEIKDSLNRMIKETKLATLPIITKDLLLAKSFVFDSLNKTLSFIKVESKKISEIYNLFSSKTEFNKFFLSFQNFIDLMNLTRGYQNIEEISVLVSKELIKKVAMLEALGTDLSEVITGSITAIYGKLSGLRESRVFHSGVENIQVLRSAISSDQADYDILDKYDLQFINDVCKELQEDIPKYKGKILKKTDFLEFIRQFPESLRFEVAKLLKRVKYVSFEEMGHLILKELNNIVEDPKNSYIISFKNGWQKSQDTWLYITQKLSEESFNILGIEDLKDYVKEINDNQEYNFIFLDDVILTGSQFVNFFEEEMDNDIDDIEKINVNNEKIRFYIVAGLGSFGAKRLLSQQIHLIEENLIRFGHTLKERDKAFYQGNFQDSFLRDDLIYFLKEKHPLEWNGYRNSQSLVILEWNTPDNTIGSLRKNTPEWRALFPR